MRCTSGTWADRDPAYSAMLALAAYQVQPTDEAISALFRPYLESQGVTSVLSHPQAGLSEVQVSRDGRVVAAATTSRTVTIWTRQPGQEPRRIRTPILAGTEAVMALAPDGSAAWLVDDGWLSRFDVSGGELQRVTEVGTAGGQRLAVSADGATVTVVVTSDTGRTAGVWDAVSRRRGADRVLPADGQLMGVTAGPDGSLVARLQERDPAGQLSERVEVWGLADGAARGR